MKRLIYILFLCVLTHSLASCDFVASGSYPFAQGYDFDVSTSELMRRIKELKKEHPELNVFRINESGDTVDTDNESESFYRIRFKVITQKNDTLNMYCVVYRSPGQARLLFDRISSDLQYDFKHINTDELTDEENEFMKCCFEEKILNRTKLKWERR